MTSILEGQLSQLSKICGIYWLIWTPINLSRTSWGASAIEPLKPLVLEKKKGNKVRFPPHSISLQSQSQRTETTGTLHRISCASRCARVASQRVTWVSDGWNSTASLQLFRWLFWALFRPPQGDASFFRVKRVRLLGESTDQTKTYKNRVDRGNTAMRSHDISSQLSHRTRDEQTSARGWQRRRAPWARLSWLQLCWPCLGVESGEVWREMA